MKWAFRQIGEIWDKKKPAQCANTGPARISPEEDTPYRLILYPLPGSLASGTYVPVAVFFVPIFHCAGATG